jgi:hypothetical protein
MMRNILQFGLGVMAGVMLICLVLLGVFGPMAEPSYADTVPTPVYLYGSDDALNVTYWSAEALAASAGSSGYQLVRYEYQDIQWVIDQGETNTATIKLQYSNDNSNWSDGPAIVSSNAADGDGMVQAANLGRYTRAYVTLENTETITITLKAVAK